jgi:hypothetical protein
MSVAQIVQLLITLAGIAVAVMAFLYEPYGMLGNGLIALLIFIAAGPAAGVAYARLAAQRKP